MGRLLYSAIASLDGFVEDAQGAFDWGAPDEEVHGFINELERPIGTYLYGRRMYETMVFWEHEPAEAGDDDVGAAFAQIWRAADKVVYSRTLASPSSARTRIERRFDVEETRRLKDTLGHDLTIGGADLAGQAVAAGLVDELRLFTVPVVVGGGKPWLPPDVHLALALLETRRFAGGVVYSRYAVAGA